MILAGDVGGTKCNLALYDVRGEEYQQIAKCRYESRKFSTFDAIITKFLSDIPSLTKKADAGKIEAAGLGVAGPVIDHRVKATNLPWTVDGAALATQLATRHVVLLNDLEATAYSLALLGPSEISTLNRGVPAPQTTQALVAAGTGLGEAVLFWNGDRYVVGSSEGGHTDFAPRTEREIELLRHMKRRNEFVSVELILSGRGFQTLDLWTAMYGAEAGNLALKVLARGGVWVAGGIAVKIRKKMEDGAFFRAFCEKEKFGALLAQIPIQMVLNEEAPLLGAMSQAARAAGLRK